MSCWRPSISFAEAVASLSASAPSYGLAEHIGVVPIVMAELKFREVQRQVLSADIVIGAEDSTLEQSPEGIQILSVNHAGNVLASGMVRGVVRVDGVQTLIAYVLISRYESHLIAYRLADEVLKSFCGSVFDHLANNVTLPADCADDSDFAGTNTASAGVFALVFVLVLFFTANVRFIYLNDTHQFLKVGIAHPGPEPMAHVPRCRVRRSNLALDLLSADSLFAVQHRVEHFKPSRERILGVLENCTCRDRETIGVPAPAFDVRALPMPRHRDSVDSLGLTATRAPNNLWPTPLLEEPFA